MSSTTTQVSIKVGSEDQITLTKLPVKIENLGSDYTALAVNEDSQAIDVMVKGTSNVIKSITAEDIRVYVDLSGLSPGVNKVTVQVSSSDTRVTVQPVTTEVEIKINKK